MATVAQTIRENQARDVQRQLSATNFEAPEVEQVPNGIPSTSNDQALSQHLADMRASNAEYAKLRTEEARSQWENIVADNFRRDQANKDQIKTQMAVSQTLIALKASVCSVNFRR